MNIGYPSVNNRKTKRKMQAMMNFKKDRGKGIPGETNSGAGDKVDAGLASTGSQEVRRKILVVAKDHAFSAGVMDYAISLSQRLGYDLIAMNVNPALGDNKFFSPYKQHLRGKFNQRAQAAWAALEPEIRSQGIHCDHTVKFEDLTTALKDLNHEVKRIDFVITDAGIKDEEITGEIPLPVFSITGYQGEKVMVKEQETGRVKLIGRTIALGVGSAALYAAVFLNTGTVMEYFTKGGIYAALPVATVFIFSFVHGAFTSNIWSVLGIEATKKVQTRVAAKRPAARKRPRPQLRLNA